MITRKNIIKHELIGLRTAVLESSNPAYHGISGMIVNETKNLITIKTTKGTKKVQKNGSTFMITLPDRKKVKVDGDRLVAKPEDRIKLKVRKW